MIDSLFGRSPDWQVIAGAPPSQTCVQWRMARSLVAYSCGGSSIARVRRPCGQRILWIPSCAGIGQCMSLQNRKVPYCSRFGGWRAPCAAITRARHAEAVAGAACDPGNCRPCGRPSAQGRRLHIRAWLMQGCIARHTAFLSASRRIPMSEIQATSSHSRIRGGDRFHPAFYLSLDDFTPSCLHRWNRLRIDTASDFHQPSTHTQVFTEKHRKTSTRK